MDLHTKKTVVPRKIKTQEDEANRVSGEAVDRNLLDMLRSLQLSGDASSFSDSISSCIQKIGYDLRLAHHLIHKADRGGLDQLAQSLTQNALKIGATRLLSAAIEMQGLARIGDLTAVEEIVNGLESELRVVEKHLV